MLIRDVRFFSSNPEGQGRLARVLTRRYTGPLNISSQGRPRRFKNRLQPANRLSNAEL